jgi:concanavalin A-like lectin/glucanase superfamily protein
MAFLILVPSVLIFFRPTKAHADWFDDNYAYRQKFSFTHNADIYTEQAITFSLDTAELITAGVMQADCDDTRFTDINGKLLRYQLTGTCNNAATTYEVVFPRVFNGANPAFVYYGNPQAASASVNVSSVTALTPSGGDPAITTRTSEEKAPSPALYLKFDENYGTSTQDQSPNNNDGSLSGAAWREKQFCLSENCLFFDGVDDVVTVTNADSIDMDRELAGALTFQAWIRPNGAGEGTGGQIFFKGTNTWLRVDTLSNGKLDIEASLNLATPATLNVSSAIDNNKWNFVALSYTDDADDEITIWVNGKNLGSSTNGVGAPSADTNNFLIGGTTTNNFQGFIDEVKIYPVERTGDQIKTDTTKITSLHGISAAFGPDESYLSNGLVGYWKMDDGVGNPCPSGVNKACDSSGNGNDGTWNNGVASTSGKFANATIERCINRISL